MPKIINILSFCTLSILRYRTSKSAMFGMLKNLLGECYSSRPDLVDANPDILEAPTTAMRAKGKYMLKMMKNIC